MKSHPRRQRLRWLSIFVLAGLVAISSMFVFSSPTFAAACNPGVPLDASGGSASCDMSIGATIGGGALVLINDAAAYVPENPFTITGSSQEADFNFQSVVKDHRGSTAGWTEKAASTGLSDGITTFPLNFTDLDPSSTCRNGSCPPVTFTPIAPLTASPATFLTAGNVAHTLVVEGDYIDSINGDFTIPAGSSAGQYNGIITITLQNSF